MKKILTLLFTLILTTTIFPCTTLVISGKFTTDGRPIIWKLRDTENYKNSMMFFEDGKYKYIGLINSEDTEGKNVWAGANSEGFSIMNSASYNVNLNDTTSKKDLEGIIMKMALQQCATLEDFEKLLDNLEKPMGLASHFGVIDGNGGAAFYEVNNYTYTKFDANDSKTAPNGYILRTNFSMTGKENIGYGFIRFETAENLLTANTSKLNYQEIIQKYSRCLKHSLLNKDFRTEYEKIPYGENFINSGDLITRHGSASAIIIQGTKENEPKDLNMIWTLVGFPSTSVAIPVWVKGGKNLPTLLVKDSTNNAPLNNYALALKNKCYPISRSSGFKYLNISELVNSEGTGIIQKIEKLETTIFEETEKKLSDWRNKKVTETEINKFYRWIDNYVVENYRKEFELE
ncbi:MAG: hypothetical protein CR986_07520 [Ignavibacteriae bacterium]|nr:MAG: hypothetical protein CR986_07520 [Ignavibacteriota bacterium]